MNTSRQQRLPHVGRRTAAMFDDRAVDIESITILDWVTGYGLGCHRF
jgi:hypothetical protein